MISQENKTDNDELDNTGARLFLGVVIFLITVISVSVFIFYSTMRSRSIGIANGYLKAVEIAFQTGVYRVGHNDLPNNSFETGIYNVKVFSANSKIDNTIIIKVIVKDKVFKVTHYSEELRLFPIFSSEENNLKEDLKSEKEKIN